MKKENPMHPDLKKLQADARLKMAERFGIENPDVLEHPQNTPEHPVTLRHFLAVCSNGLLNSIVEHDYVHHAYAPAPDGQCTDQFMYDFVTASTNLLEHYGLSVDTPLMSLNAMQVGQLLRTVQQLALTTANLSILTVAPHLGKQQAAPAEEPYAKVARSWVTTVTDPDIQRVQYHSR